MGGAGPNQDLLFVLMNNALTNTAELSTYWSVQHRHPDGHRWLDLAHYLTKDDAEAALARAREGFPEEDVQVDHVRR